MRAVKLFLELWKRQKIFFKWLNIFSNFTFDQNFWAKKSKFSLKNQIFINVYKLYNIPSLSGCPVDWETSFNIELDVHFSSRTNYITRWFLGLRFTKDLISNNINLTNDIQVSAITEHLKFYPFLSVDQTWKIFCWVVFQSLWLHGAFLMLHLSWSTLKLSSRSTLEKLWRYSTLKLFEVFNFQSCFLNFNFSVLQAFTDTVHRQAHQAKMFKDDMKVSRHFVLNIWLSATL